jgi:hypothetical protein
VILKCDHADHKDFVFREHQYAWVKKILESNDETHDLCANFETFISLVDEKFVERFKSEVKITSSKIQMREIDFKTHEISKYCFLDLYFREHFSDSTYSERISLDEWLERQYVDRSEHYEFEEV